MTGKRAIIFGLVTSIFEQSFWVLRAVSIQLIAVGSTKEPTIQTSIRELLGSILDSIIGNLEVFAFLTSFGEYWDSDVKVVTTITRVLSYFSWYGTSLSSLMYDMCICTVLLYIMYRFLLT
jgi:hypothetical protein